MSRDHWPHEEDGQAPADEQAPYEPFWVRWRKPVTDEQFVEKIRKGKDSMKRWKWALVLLHLGIIAVILSFIPKVIEFTADLLVMLGPAQPGGMPVIAREIVLVGLTVGASIGFQFMQSLHALVSILLPDRPADLLLKYHDLAQQLKHTDHTT